MICQHNLSESYDCIFLIFLCPLVHNRIIYYFYFLSIFFAILWQYEFFYFTLLYYTNIILQKSNRVKELYLDVLFSSFYRFLLFLLYFYYCEFVILRDFCDAFL